MSTKDTAVAKDNQLRRSFLLELSVEPWPGRVSRKLGLHQQTPYIWASRYPEIREAIQWAAGVRHMVALEQIDEVIAGQRTDEVRFKAMTWRAGRGPQGQWLGGHPTDGDEGDKLPPSITIINQLNTVEAPRPFREIEVESGGKDQD